MTATPCSEPGCPGTVLADGYCDTCGALGAAARPVAAPAAAGAAGAGAGPAVPAGGAGGGGGTLLAGLPCLQSGCPGTVLPDGYCDTCGALAAPSPAPAPAPVAAAGAGVELDGGRGSVPSVSIAALTTGSARARGSRRTTSARTASSRRQAAIGAGLVDVPAAPLVDPRSVVMANPEVAEDKRFCSSCGAPVGRSRGDEPGRVQGFCGKCRNRFDFVPKLNPGEMVGGQYQVVGVIAHGGLGWIYLAQDRAVNDRWVVLKGLLDAGDEAAMAVAVAEKRFLAEVQHPNIVQIYNFATHRESGYIVMEYVGGPSLKVMLKQRRKAAGDKPDPLPVDVAIAFVLAALPAFSYLHGRGLVYCDFKPDNLCQVADQVKMIDLGAVRRLDDPSGDVYGTAGYQAPEIATAGPSIASDVYTIGRTLGGADPRFPGIPVDVRAQPSRSGRPSGPRPLAVVPPAAAQGDRPPPRRPVPVGGRARRSAPRRAPPGGGAFHRHAAARPQRDLRRGPGRRGAAGVWPSTPPTRRPRSSPRCRPTTRPGRWSP